MARDDHDELDTVVEQTSESIARELEESIKIPAFSSIVARAQRLDPSQVGPLLFRETKVPEVRADREVIETEQLAQFVRAARVEAEADIRDHIADIGDSPQLATSLFARRPRRLRYVVVVAAAAAAVFLAFRGFPDAPSAARQASEQNFYQSVVDHSTKPRQTEVERQQKAPQMRTTTIEGSPTDEQESLDWMCFDEHESGTVAPLETSEPAQSDINPENDLQKPGDGEMVTPTKKQQPARDTLHELDDRAEDALANGELEVADELYREIIRRGGRSRRADRAYGDRFTIARRLRTPAQRAALWREYLSKFPRGRFAEDALAGLCQAQPRLTQTAQACWRKLLERYPEGVYANEARRALTEHPTPEGAL